MMHEFSWRRETRSILGEKPADGRAGDRWYGWNEGE